MRGNHKYDLPQNGAYEAEDMGSISMWFRPFQFLLHQDCDRQAQMSQRRTWRTEEEVDSYSVPTGQHALQ